MTFMRMLLVLIALAPMGATPTNAAEPAQAAGMVVGSQDASNPAQRDAGPVAVFETVGEDASGAIVSVFSNARVTRPIADDAVAVFGNLFIDSEVGGDAVVVFGDMQLGPRAVVHGEAVVVGGRLTRDPLATVHGGVQEISFGARLGNIDWLQPWVEQALFYGRPLAITPGLGWAWTLAAGSLALYVLISLLFGGAVRRCVETFEQYPGESLITALLTVLLLPVLLLLLLVTVVGITVIPFILIGLFCTALFGKPVILAALGGRLASFAGASARKPGGMPVALATLIGGVFVTLLYLIPVLGFIAFNVVGILGLGAVLYTSLLLIRARPSGTPPFTTGNAANPDPGATQAGTAAHTGAPAPSVAAMRAAQAGTGDRTHGEPAANFGDAPGTSSADPAQPASQSHDPQFHGSRTADQGGAPGGMSSTPAASALAALPRAGFGIRMIALLIDTILIAIVINVLTDGNLFLLILAAYGAVMWKLKGTTIGGIVCHLSVVRLDGHELGWDTAIVRALSCFLSIAVAGLGFFWILFDGERQSWHDKIAGTVVVRSPKSMSLL